VRGQGAHNHRTFGDDAYAAKPECISVLAPLLGLDSETSPETTKAAVLKLLQQAQANERELSIAIKDAAQLVSLAIAPEPGRLDLYQEVRPVAFKGNLRTVGAVKEALTVLKDALSSHTTSEVAQSVPPVAKRNTFDGVASPTLPRQGVMHIAELIPLALERPADKRVEAFERALRYLQASGIIAPNADENKPPSLEVTQKLAKHYMVWKWNSKTGSWDPRLNTPRNQSLFTASIEYLKKIPLGTEPDRKQFILSTLQAKRVEKNPTYLASRSLDERMLISSLKLCASHILTREVSLPTVMRLQALYRFLNPTPPQSTDSR